MTREIDQFHFQGEKRVNLVMDPDGIARGRQGWEGRDNYKR